MSTANCLETLNTMSFTDLVAKFPNEKAAIEFLEAVRWPSGPSCFRCGCVDVSPVKSRRVRPIYYCTGCKTQFSVTTGTVMEDTKIPLHKWLMAIHLMCASKEGDQQPPASPHARPGPPFGLAPLPPHPGRYGRHPHVEADETYIGGKARGAGKGRGLTSKTAVIAMVERDGSARVHVMPEGRVDQRAVEKILYKHISP